MNPDYKLYGDQLLFQKLTNHDQDAFDEIYKRYSTTIFKTAYNILRDRQNAEDVVQEIFLTLWKRRSELQIQSLGPYLNQSAWYLALRMQKEQRKNAQLYLQFQKVSDEILREDPVLFNEFKTILEKIISELPPDELEIFQNSREKNMTHSQIAKHMNIHQKKVERKISDSLRRIRIQLGNWILLLALLLSLLNF